MKLLLVLATLTLTSCGLSEGLNKNCGEDIKMGCRAIFGYTDEDQNKEIAANTFKNDVQDKQILALQNANLSLISIINSYNDEILFLEQADEINTQAITTITGNISDIQDEINLNLITLQALQLSVQGSVTKLIDVCGDDLNNFDEVILKTTDGRYIAYFEDGGKRFLTEITEGDYTTTDRQRCDFSITPSGLEHEVDGLIKID